MKIKIEKVILTLFLFLFPVVSLAAGLKAASDKIVELFAAFPKLLFGMGVCYFLYGLGQYISGSGKGKKDENILRDAKNTMVYGILGIFVMASIAGIIGLVREAIGI